ncbi:MAG: phosphopantetheine-binding protein [Pseudomonadota bacterium]
MNVVTDTENLVFTIIAEKAAAIIPGLEPSSISMDGKLEDYGCNSIDRTDIVWMVQEALGLNIPVAEFSGVSDIRSLIELLVRHMDAQ